MYSLYTKTNILKVINSLYSTYFRQAFSIYSSLLGKLCSHMSLCFFFYTSFLLIIVTLNKAKWSLFPSFLLLRVWQTHLLLVSLCSPQRRLPICVCCSHSRSLLFCPPSLWVRGKQEMAVWGVVGCLSVGFIIQKCNTLLAYLVNSVSLHYSLWYFSTTLN